MEKIVGIQYITSKKNGLHYKKISTLDSIIYNQPGEREGQNVGEYFICQEEIQEGKIELVGGELRLGANIRVMKESVNGLDRVAMIMVYDEVSEHFMNVDNAGGFESEKAAEQSQEKKTSSPKK